MKKKAPKAPNRYPTPHLEKGLDILELFASEPSGLTKSDVARKLGRTISEIFRMLLCLEERGYIAQSPDSDRYHLSLHLFKLAQEHPPIKRMTMQALPIMQQVAHELSQSCHLGVLNGSQVVIIGHHEPFTCSGSDFREKAPTCTDSAYTPGVRRANLGKELLNCVGEGTADSSVRRKSAQTSE